MRMPKRTSEQHSRFAPRLGYALTVAIASRQLVREPPSLAMPATKKAKTAKAFKAAGPAEGSGGGAMSAQTKQVRTERQLAEEAEEAVAEHWRRRSAGLVEGGVGTIAGLCPLGCSTEGQVWQGVA